jgi:hypothetical protein
LIISPEKPFPGEIFLFLSSNHFSNPIKGHHANKKDNIFRIPVLIPVDCFPKLHPGNLGLCL